MLKNYDLTRKAVGRIALLQ